MATCGEIKPQQCNPELLGQMILKSLLNNGTKIAQINAETEVQMTYHDIWLETVRIAQNLQKREYKPREVFSFMVDHADHLLPTVLSSMCLACPFHAMHPLLSKQEIITTLSKVKPSAIFCAVDEYNRINEALKEMKCDIKIFIIDGKINGLESIEDLLTETGIEDSFVPIRIDPENDFVAIFCSSGTTGPAKSLTLSYGLLVPWLNDLQKFHLDDSYDTCGITGRSYTYSRLRDHSAALAIRLHSKLNLQIGETIAVCLPNIPEFPIAVLGAMKAGLVVTTLNPIYTASEIQRQLEASKAKAIIGTPKAFGVLKEAVANMKKDIKILCIKTDTNDSIPNGAIDFADFIETSNVDFSLLRPHNRHPDDIAFLPFSSGTTGLPKGVMLSHNNIAVNCEQCAVKIGEAPIVLPTTKEYQEVSPSVLPFFHIYGFTVLMVSKLAQGCKIVSLPEFKPNTFLSSIRDHKATLLQVVPPIMIFMGHHSGVSAEDLKTVRIVMSGAAPLGALDVERFFTKAPNAAIIQGYGLTETSPVALLNMPGNTKYASIGVPASATRAKIVAINDQSGVGLPANQTGELWVKGPQNMLGYLNNQTATDEMLVDGWIRTGDIACYDDDGFFYVTDRLKELIKVKGFQVAPAELEEILRSHPDITDAAVVGIKHDKHGEAPSSFVTKRPESQVTGEDIKVHLKNEKSIQKL